MHSVLKSPHAYIAHSVLTSIDFVAERGGHTTVSISRKKSGNKYTVTNVVINPHNCFELDEQQLCKMLDNIAQSPEYCVIEATKLSKDLISDKRWLIVNCTYEQLLWLEAHDQHHQWLLRSGHFTE